MQDLIEKLPQSPNLTELAYRTLKGHMLNGALGEGARLTEEVLARQLGISKSPVREALNRLEVEGLISIQARRGAHVRRFSLQETKDLFDLRELLEVHAVSNAQVTPELLDALEKCNGRGISHLKDGDKVAHMEEDLRFHSLIAASTGNQEFLRVFESVQHKTILSRSKTYHLQPSSAPIRHHRIVAALRQGNRAAAIQAMSEHVIELRDSLLAFIREHGEGAMPEKHDAVIA